MRSIKIFTLTIASVFLSLSAVSVVHAQTASDDAREVVNAEEREKIWDKVRGKKGKNNDDDMEDESDMDEDHDDDMDMDDESEVDEGHDDEEMSEMDRAEKSDKMRSKAKGAKSKGNEKSQEMRARRDERKAIMKEHKSGGKPGENEDLDRPNDKTAKNSGGIDADDTKDEIDEEAKKPKKPWWRFWGE